ncbi:MAG TPA: FAD-dependent oxidoreductase [Allosphingosinicella sp.]|jgi:D-arginine dehydrogenase|nr:FAD-dependent oxidoreductase [Allosphingosinicella sp.]
MDGADFLIIGGGIAGLSAAARLARHGKAIVVEAEDALGYHSSGRSVSFSHYGIGGEAVRALTAHSRPFFEQPPAGFSEVPVAKPFASLYFAAGDELPALESLAAAMAEFTDAIRPLDADGLTALCPVLETGPGAAVRGLLDPTGLKLDADALLHGFARAVRALGSEIRLGHRIASIERRGEAWIVDGSLSAPILVNAAGAWADTVASLAGVAPLGLQPKRRTIIAVDPPAGADIAAWPFAHSVAGDFYMLAEAGRLLVSPVDEVADDPCDAQPDDYDIAFAADRLEHYTCVRVARIAHRWAGLRTFTADRVPTAGFAPGAPGFLWLAGQGGYGLQTAPAMAQIVEALVTGALWPAGLAATPAQIRPERLLGA